MKKQINEKAPNSYVICKICDKKFARITKTHLKIHNITPEEYKKKYNISKYEYVSKNLCNSQSITLKSFKEKYGKKEGLKRWKSYCDKQAYSNSFEYKKEKHGWTREQFNEYNKSRAVTKENLIKRYNKTEGLKRWESYCSKQAYAGSSLEYFVDKYGLIEGQNKWDIICKSKSNNLKNFIKRYGNENGIIKFNQYQKRKNKDGFYSIISQILFDDITKNISDKNHIYYQKLKNKEYGCWLHGLNKYTFLDFYDLDQNKCIEFYGDYWHCNPELYTEKFEHPHINETAKNIWKRDKQRLHFLKLEYNIDILTIWEYDYLHNKEDAINKCKQFLGYKI